MGRNPPGEEDARGNAGQPGVSETSHVVSPS
jgi:hypothetical protein